MKKYLLIGCIYCFCTLGVNAQDSTYFELGQGLNLSLNEGDYAFTFGGTLKPIYTYLHDSSLINPGRHQFNMQLAQFSFRGEAKNERISFYLLADLVETWALLEAWIGMDVADDKLFIAIGQKLVDTNNKELMNHRNFLQFVERSILSSNFARLGREFGIFLSSTLEMSGIVIKPSLSVTSGDGINSFGNGTTDRFDYGGAKFGGRIEILPFGDFTNGNAFLGADLLRESKPKLSIGTAFSTNQGASESVGEGHGEFLFFSQLQQDGSFRDAYPNYQKIYADLLFKYRGFNLGMEYVNAFGSEVFGLFTDTDATDQTPIFRGDIAQFLTLGSGYNIQAGYLTKDFWSFDLRYTQVIPEYNEEPLSVLTNQEAVTFGISKFLKGQALKLQLNGDYLVLDEFNGGLEQRREIRGSLAMQVIF